MLTSSKPRRKEKRNADFNNASAKSFREKRQIIFKKRSNPEAQKSMLCEQILMKPVAADVRRLKSNAEFGVRNAE